MPDFFVKVAKKRLTIYLILHCKSLFWIRLVFIIHLLNYRTRLCAVSMNTESSFHTQHGLDNDKAICLSVQQNPFISSSMSAAIQNGRNVEILPFLYNISNTFTNGFDTLCSLQSS